MSTILFFIAGFGVIAGAVGVVVLRDPFYSVLALVGHLISLAVLFLLLRAEFVAAAQVVVYAGAVMVLYVFVVAYVGGTAADSLGDGAAGSGRGARFAGSSLRLAGAIAGGALLIELLIALLGTGLKAISGYGAPYAPGPRTFGTPAASATCCSRAFCSRSRRPRSCCCRGRRRCRARRAGGAAWTDRGGCAELTPARSDAPAGHRYDRRGRRTSDDR